MGSPSNTSSRACSRCTPAPTTPRSGEAIEIANRGEYQWRRDGELHLFNPRTVQKLQHATREKRFDIFKEYTTMVDDQASGKLTLRALMDFVPSATPLSIDEVESVASIIKRFSTGAMSYGSISEESHTTLAIAMNRLGGKSNTGEGGEDADRFDTVGPRQQPSLGDQAGRVGSFRGDQSLPRERRRPADQDGPGRQARRGRPTARLEGLPWIAKTRHSTPGVGLISPPPHHDIYSIEDLAQLIYDLKNANDQARINVKLVSEQGVGRSRPGSPRLTPTSSSSRVTTGAPVRHRSRRSSTPVRPGNSASPKHTRPSRRMDCAVASSSRLTGS